ncbi:unnamed protein product [Absidia cylindrospora]
MGRLVASGSRDLVQKYNLKKRHYLGTTLMDAELSLVMANQALASSGKLEASYSPVLTLARLQWDLILMGHKFKANQRIVG